MRNPERYDAEVISFIILFGEYIDHVYCCFRIAFFSADLIPAGTELCYDYGYFPGNVDGKHRACLCGAEYCRQILY